MTSADKIALASLFIALASLVLSFVALAVSVYQTYVSRESLIAARESLTAALRSIEMSTKARQLESLPKAELFIVVLQRLTGWQNDLEQIREDLKTARRSGPDDPQIKAIARQRGLNSRKGLVEEPWYEHCPRWLQIIWTTGASHYYKCKNNVPYLWDFKENIPSSEAEDLIDQFDESIGHISELRSYMKNVVPEAYLKCPDLDDRHFLEE